MTVNTACTGESGCRWDVGCASKAVPETSAGRAVAVAGGLSRALSEAIGVEYTAWVNKRHSIMREDGARMTIPLRGQK